MSKARIIQRHEVPALDRAVRISDYAIGLFIELPSRASLKKAFKKGRILLNDQQAHSGDWLKQGDIIALMEAASIPRPYRMILDLVHLDNHLAIIHKPAGIIVSGNQFRSIQNVLPYNLSSSPEPDALQIPRPLHRLDAPTQGLLMVARTARAQMEFSRQFEEGEIKKTYEAIIVGEPPRQTQINSPIDGKPAITDMESLSSTASLRSGHLTHLKLFPQTGRTHQLRKHLASIGKPIAGDKLYGTDGEVLLHKGLFLAATALDFFHPFEEKRLKIELPTPTKFYSYLDREQRRWLKFKEQ